ncbi:hypothetical protein QF049_004803 [Paenibacillus sp. W4I10]|nr:hypothetical protein [Paenibacillus sp. W4I10]
MDLDNVEIKDYYDTEIINYDFTNLINSGISEENAHFLIDIGVPENNTMIFPFMNLKLSK